MQVFEKIIEKLEEIKALTPILVEYQEADDIENRCSEIIDMVTEYNNGWIPCDKEMPPQPKENPLFDNKPLELYLVSEKNMDYPIRAFWNGKFFTDGWARLDVRAWQPLPPAYRKGE